MAEEAADISIESTLAGIAGGHGIERGFGQRELIQPFYQDGLDRPVAGISKLQGTATGRFQPDRAISVAQAQNSLDRTQVVEDAISNQLLHQGVAG